MRNLLIVRHAKSDWGDWTLADHDRPLARRGVKALGRMREHVADGPPPDLVLCSSARRTVDTFEGIRDAVPDDVIVEFDHEVYGADAATLLALVRDVDDAVVTAMLIGHNPGAQDLALRLAGEGEPDDLRQLATKFPTGAIATLTFDTTWADVAAGTGRLTGLFTPRPPR